MALRGFGVTVKVEGLKASRQAVRRSLKRFEPEQKRNVELAGEVVIGEAKKQFQGSRTRSLYKIKGGRRVRRVPPRPITSPPDKLGVWEGQYRKSITQSLDRRDKVWRTEIGPEGIVYATVHEFGRRGMPKRPVMAPAVEAAEKRVFQLIGRTFRVVEI